MSRHQTISSKKFRSLEENVSNWKEYPRLKKVLIQVLMEKMEKMSALKRKGTCESCPAVK